MESENRSYQFYYKEVIDNISMIVSEEIDKIKRDPWKEKEVMGIYVVTPITPEGNLTFKFVEIHDDNVSKNTKYINIDSKENCEKIGLPSEIIEVESKCFNEINPKEFGKSNIIFDRDNILSSIQKNVELDNMKTEEYNDKETYYSTISNDIKYRPVLTSRNRKSTLLKSFNR